jgi:hypothetical protein
LIRSPGRTDITLSTKYLRRSRRADILYFYMNHYSVMKSGSKAELAKLSVVHLRDPGSNLG